MTYFSFRLCRDFSHTSLNETAIYALFYLVICLFWSHVCSFLCSNSSVYLFQILLIVSENCYVLESFLISHFYRSPKTNFYRKRGAILSA